MLDSPEKPEPFLADKPETVEQVRRQLSRILGSKRFHRSTGLKSLLQFVVEESLAGRSERLKARTIAVKALGRNKDFDARADPIVSIQAGRLRRALGRYYENEGQSDPIVISLPVGRYVPTFTIQCHEEEAASAGSPALSNRSFSGAEPPTIAVCQFVNLGPDPEQGFFAAGITQEIITELTRFQELRVLTCQQPPCTLGGSQDPVACDCDFDTRFVLRGATRRTDESARINAQLVDARSRHQLWAESYKRELSTTDLLDAQDQIAQSVVAAVADNYGVISRTLSREVRSQPPKEFSSYEAVLRFRHYQFEVSDESREAAVSALEQAVQRDPQYALAWAMLSEATVDAFGLRIDTSPNVISTAKQHARRALSLDPECQHAHWAMTLAHFHAREREPLLREADETIALNPNNGYLVGAATWAMALAGDWHRALPALREIMHRNPHYPTWFHLAPYLDHYRRGDFEEALLHAEKFNTELAWDPIVRAAALGQMDRREEAHAAVAELQTRFPTAAADPAQYLRGYIFFEELVQEVTNGLRKASLCVATQTTQPNIE